MEKRPKRLLDQVRDVIRLKHYSIQLKNEQERKERNRHYRRRQLILA